MEFGSENPSSLNYNIATQSGSIVGFTSQKNVSLNNANLVHSIEQANNELRTNVKRNEQKNKIETTEKQATLLEYSDTIDNIYDNGYGLTSHTKKN